MTSKQDSIKEPRIDSDTRKRLLACLICGLLAASLWWVPGPSSFLHRQMREVQDHNAANDMRLTPHEDFVFLGIDASSLKVDGIDPEIVDSNATLTRMVSQWPWDRRVYAAAIDRLAESGVKLIVVDIVFAQPATEEEDKAFKKAIDRHRDKIVLASAFIPQDRIMNVLEPIEPFLGPLDDETSVGYVNFWPHGEDRLVKRAHLKMSRNEANGETPHPDEPVYLSLAAAAAKKLGKELLEDEKRFRMARVEGENLDAVYKPLSLHTIFIPYDWKTTYEGGEYFRDKIVFIGPAAPTFQDSHDTPAGRIYGAQLHMHVLGAILDDAWYEEAAFGGGGAYFSLLILLGLILSCSVVLRWNKTLHLAVAALCGIIVWHFGEQLTAHKGHRLLGSMASATTFSFGVLGAIIWQAMTERAKRQQLHRHLQRSMSPDVADAIVKAPDGYYRAASGNRKQVTVLFADIRGFTSRSEQQDAGELVSQLNEYLGGMVEVIFAHGGTVDKFIGDAIMATWGGLDDSNIAKQNEASVGAAKGMLTALAELNAQWKKDGKEPFRIGAGIHHGEAIVGEIGSDQRTDFTVIGDAVNLASRIEGMTKAMGVDLLVTASVIDELSQKSEWLDVGAIRVKGRDEGVNLFTHNRASEEGRTQFQEFLSEFQKGNFTKASGLLTTLEGEGELAGLVGFYQSQIKHLSENPASTENWDGVLRMETK